MSSNYVYPDAAILIFCKAPVPGKVKTRLLATLTPAQAAAVHARLSRTLVTRLISARLAPVYLYCHPDTRHPFFGALKRRYGVRLEKQQGADLGDRMARAFRDRLSVSRAALIVGCDCPSLTPADFRAALTMLSQNTDVVLGPAEDGGYVLIGLPRPQPELFREMAWGKETVLADTRRRIRDLNLKAWELPLQWDLDRPRDLRRWQSECRGASGRTR
ncbi:TIGR04282 family arsenosugar biosynthesis glycosyltransferase [Methylohalobius crimeensis]|uniref:TIGR04282 family arsenosugar biosynthesis glycosyltransferase n=1 Tax=Methylohalobius crimeensis TaxID=244365 RepID=UPI0003B5BFF4|nr:TIGR04282 family arsenosugar biosynthesis glycosyltransferase [Methylohalobius crimeensis]